MAATAYPHIELSGHAPVIAGTTTKVIEVVLGKLAHDWDAEEIHRQFPHLDLAAIHSALAYYYDHRAELDLAIERDLQTVEEVRARLGPSAIRLRLRNGGARP